MLFVQSNPHDFQKRQIDLIVRTTPYAMVGHLVNTVIIAVALTASVHLVPLILWTAYSCSVALLLLFRHVRNLGRLPRSFHRAAKKVTVYAILLALPWSSLGILYLGSLSEGQELLLVTLGIGMAACATVLLSAIPRAAFIYMSVILIPTAVKCLVFSQNSYLPLGALALSYWGCLASFIVKTSRDVRERQEAEVTLAERDAHLALAAKAGLVGSYVYQADLERMKVSQGYAAMHGLPEGTTETTRGLWCARVHPDDLAQMETLRTQTFIDRRCEYNVDYRIVRGGEIRWIEARSFVSYDSDGRPQRIIGVNIDVTERKRAEQALVERNIQLALAGRAAHVGSFAYDTNTELMQVSEGYAAIHGFPEGTTEIARSACLADVHPQDLERVGLARSEAFQERRNEYSAEYRIIRPGGEVRWVEIRCFIAYDGNRHPNRVIGVSIDATDRKQAEHALAERNLQLALAGKAGRVGSYAYDVKTRMLQFSEGYAAIYGLPEGTCEMTGSQRRALVHPEDLELLDRVRSQAFEQRRSEFSLEYRNILPKRGMRWTESRSLIFYDSDGHAQRLVGVNIDVTERKRAEERQRGLVAELNHRVKNILATVSAVVSHTRQGSRSARDFAAALEGRLRSIAATHELLGARWWQGVSLTELVRRELAPYAGRNNTELCGPEVVLRAEAGQAMAMVLHELATNAAKYGALSTEKGRVRIRWDRRLNGYPPRLVLEWQEIGGPPVNAPGNPSYGTSTIRDMIPYEFGGTVDLVFAPVGVQCRLELPGEWLCDDGEAISQPVSDAHFQTGQGRV
jgi:PAS domain S-box-containing protein